MKRALVPLVLAALALAGCGSSHARVVRHAPPPPGAAEQRKLAQLALKVAKSAGDAHPTNAIVVPTTRRIAESVDAGSGVGYHSSPAYFVVVRGQFKDCNVPLPPGAKCPTGTIVTLTIDPRTNTSTDSGIESRMPDVNKIGKPEPLPLTGLAMTRTAAHAPAVVKVFPDCPSCVPPVYRHDWRSRHLRLGQPDAKGAHLVTRAQIDSRNAGTVAAVLVTYGQTKGLAPDLATAPPAVVDPSRKVWLVTTYDLSSRQRTKIGGKLTSDHNSFVLDAATNTKTDTCWGCAAGPDSNTHWPVAARPTITKAQVTKDCRSAFKTKNVRVQLVWGQEGLTDVELEWQVYAPHGSITPLGTKLGSHGPVRPFVGPLGGVEGAFGAPPLGSWTVRPPRGHHILPLQSGTIPVSLVRKLGRQGVHVALTPDDIRPPIDRLRALTAAGGAGNARHIWLVDFFQPDRVRPTWLVALRNGTYALVDALSGRLHPVVATG